MKRDQFYCMRYYITYRCNSRCRYCNVWQEEAFADRKELTQDDARTLIRQCFEAGVRYIDFTGGEPLLCENLPALLRYAKTLGIKTEVTINGICQGQDRLLETVRWADKFNVSLDTLNQETYQKIRGVDGLKQVKETIETVRKLRPVRMMATVSKDNIWELDELIDFAGQNQIEIYLNPVFSYFDGEAEGEEDYTGWIREQIYEPYTIVMLHFMEWIRECRMRAKIPCSANHQTLTFAPDGSLLLPCYHAVQETLPWNGSLANMLESPVFEQYGAGKKKADLCRDCKVIPYFGISFNYRLDTCFLIQSYSEKLNHLKRDFMNSFSGQKKNQYLRSHLEEFLRMAHSLDTSGHENGGNLYWARWAGDGYETDIYRERLTEDEYQQEQEARDCWQLKLTPHHMFDWIYENIYKIAHQKYQAGERAEELTEIFADAMEFQIRWWKWYISCYMKVSITCQLKKEEDWIDRYFARLTQLGRRYGWGEVKKFPEQTLSCIKML